MDPIAESMSVPLFREQCTTCKDVHVVFIFETVSKRKESHRFRSICCRKVSSGTCCGGKISIGSLVHGNDGIISSLRFGSYFGVSSIFNKTIIFTVHRHNTVFTLTVWACCSISTSTRVGIRMCFDS